MGEQPPVVGPNFEPPSPKNRIFHIFTFFSLDYSLFRTPCFPHFFSNLGVHSSEVPLSDSHQLIIQVNSYLICHFKKIVIFCRGLSLAISIWRTSNHFWQEEQHRLLRFTWISRSNQKWTETSACPIHQWCHVCDDGNGSVWRLAVRLFHAAHVQNFRAMAWWWYSRTKSRHWAFSCHDHTVVENLDYRLGRAKGEVEPSVFLLWRKNSAFRQVSFFSLKWTTDKNWVLRAYEEHGPTNPDWSFTWQTNPFQKSRIKEVMKTRCFLMDTFNCDDSHRLLSHNFDALGFSALVSMYGPLNEIQVAPDIAFVGDLDSLDGGSTKVYTDIEFFLTYFSCFFSSKKTWSTFSTPVNRINCVKWSTRVSCQISWLNAMCEHRIPSSWQIVLVKFRPNLTIATANGF